MLESHGASRILASFHDIVPNWVFAGLYFSDEYIAEHPDIVRKVLAGLVKSMEFIKNEEKQARKYLPKYTNVDEDVSMICALREMEPMEPVERLNRQRDLMVQYGYLKNPVDISKKLDYSFLPAEARSIQQ
jgi:ABC-type nitrate/sulfonate/bicarbonate transport system substrate-binding protein